MSSDSLVTFRRPRKRHFPSWQTLQGRSRVPGRHLPFHTLMTCKQCPESRCWKRNHQVLYSVYTLLDTIHFTLHYLHVIPTIYISLTLYTYFILFTLFLDSIHLIYTIYSFYWHFTLILHSLHLSLTLYTYFTLFTLNVHYISLTL